MPQHTSKRTSTTGRKYQTARLPAGDYFGDNGRGGYFRIAANIDGQGTPPQSIEDYSLIAVRY